MGVRLEKVHLLGLEELIEKGDQKELADALKVDESTISCLVNLKRGASLGLTLRLAKRLGVSVEDLVYGRSQQAQRAS